MADVLRKFSRFYPPEVADHNAELVEKGLV
jgi:hypothetical protein